MSINNKFKIKDSSWYTAFGLALYSNDTYNNNTVNNSTENFLKQIKDFFKSIFSQLLP